ncbi:MAG: hypothetical protein AAFY17_11700 [Cyanobacteria bacterium J06642_11]
MYSTQAKQNGLSECGLDKGFMWRRWKRATNYIHGLQTYQDMSPDLLVRRQVNQSLRNHRRSLSSDAWCSECHRATHAQRDTLLFVYRSLATYSGLEFSRVRPADRLVDDLQFPLVCWFDWPLRFCDDVIQRFDVDISETFDEAELDTLADLIRFLEECLQQNP